ncbi:pirin family protein [Paenibacillus sp. 79R4]|uniref:pirin family protein n=1 Tax=Paenibacillus sp. 79R4 TaxID=2212847 RepID=UPI0015BBF23D|nr:pirin-like C-terminal cupin domain-containing protein [Paenibacillus sp. 79R4]NWL88444.1 pirin family protein [Paenibacillus sp. 79R4]
MKTSSVFQRHIAEVRRVKLDTVSPIHSAGPVLEMGKWEKNDPFLIMMEDKFRRGAFDVHPHRGLETVTFVIDGSIEHYDSQSGDGGVLGPGDVQWMTAGSGVMHNEQPSEGVTAHSLQLWVNLPRDQKMSAPRYQNLKSADMPVREEHGALIRVFSGSSHEVVSQTLNHIPVTMVEAIMEPGSTVTQDLPGSYNGFIYIIQGSGVFGSSKTPAHQGQMMWLGRGRDGEASEIEITAEEPLRFVLYAGEPVREPVVAHGPFVMNTETEIVEAFRDLRQGTFLKHS